MQPPTTRSAGLPGRFLLGSVNVYANDARMGSERGNERRIVREPQIAPEPDDAEIHTASIT